MNRLEMADKWKEVRLAWTDTRLVEKKMNCELVYLRAYKYMVEPASVSHYGRLNKINADQEVVELTLKLADVQARSANLWAECRYWEILLGMQAFIKTAYEEENEDAN